VQPDHGPQGASAPADWYPDHSRPGRLRYWDGAAWSAWVSTSGDTTLDPDPVPSGPPPAVAGTASPPPGATVHGGPPPGGDAFGGPPPGGPAAAAPPPSAGGTATRPSLGVALGSPTGIGLLVAALGAILVSAAGGQTAVRQEGLFGGSFEIRIEPGFLGALVAAVILAVAAVLPQLWAKLAGVLVAGAIAVGAGFLMIAARTSDDFVSGRSITIETGGWLLILGSLLAFAGLALALYGIAKRPPEPTGGSGFSTAAIILGCASVIFWMLSPLGVATGLVGMSAGKAATGKRPGLALAGFIVGLVVLTVMSVLVIIFMLVATP
jgi:hypothetical protein